MLGKDANQRGAFRFLPSQIAILRSAQGPYSACPALFQAALPARGVGSLLVLKSPPQFCCPVALSPLSGDSQILSLQRAVNRLFGGLLGCRVVEVSGMNTRLGAMWTAGKLSCVKARRTSSCLTKPCIVYSLSSKPVPHTFWGVAFQGYLNIQRTVIWSECAAVCCQC